MKILILSRGRVRDEQSTKCSTTAMQNTTKKIVSLGTYFHNNSKYSLSDQFVLADVEILLKRPPKIRRLVEG